MNIPKELIERFIFKMKSFVGFGLVFIIYDHINKHGEKSRFCPLLVATLHIWFLLATHDASESSSIIHSAFNPQGLSISVAGESKITAGV